MRSGMLPRKRDEPIGDLCGLFLLHPVAGAIDSSTPSNFVHARFIPSRLPAR